MTTYAFGIENKMKVDLPSDNFSYENIEDIEDKFHGRVLEKICGRLTEEAERNRKEYFCVCICIYNEELNDFENTVSSVLKNFEFMKRSTKFSNDKFGKSIQEKFNNLELLLVPIFDGITQKNDDKKVKPIMKDSMMKWLNDFVFEKKDYIEKWRERINEYLENADQTTDTTHSFSVDALQSRLSHWFMVSPSSDLSLDSSPSGKYVKESDYIYFYMAPIIKAQNHKKHNSHDWFFRGICEGLGQYCLYAFLTDVGTNYKVDCLAKLTYGLLYNHSLIGVTGRQRVALPGKYFLPCTEKECCFNSNDRPDFPFSSKESFKSYCYWLVRSLEWYHFPWILFRFLWSLYILFINIVRILLYPIMSLFFSFWTRTEHKENSIDDLPCFYCWLSYIFSLSLLQGFEFEGSLLLTSSPFNVVEALPVMPGPCQLFDWQKMNSRSIVKEYFNILLAGDDSRNIDFKKISPSFAVNLAREPPESSIESDKSKLICGVNLRESLEFNMRLAEDRILSFVSVLSGYGTKWISGATFYYQPELRIQSLIKQRRRWINGTFASFIYFFVSRRARNQVLGGFFDNENGWKNNRILFLLWGVQLLQLLFVMISPSVFAVAIYGGIENLAENVSSFEHLNERLKSSANISLSFVITAIYFVIYAIWSITSNLVKGGTISEYFCWFCALSGMICMLPVYHGWTLPNNYLGGFVIYLLAVSLLLPILLAIPQSITCACLYILYLPYFLLFIIFFLVFIPAYSFARIFDSTWGNRDSGRDKSVTSDKEKSAKRLNFYFVFFLILLNGSLTVGLTASIHRINQFVYMFVLFLPGIIQLVASFFNLYVLTPINTFCLIKQKRTEAVEYQTNQINGSDDMKAKLILTSKNSSSIELTQS